MYARILLFLLRRGETGIVDDVRDEHGLKRSCRRLQRHVIALTGLIVARAVRSMNIAAGEPPEEREDR